jgi:Ca2+-transporting ATPase
VKASTPSLEEKESRQNELEAYTLPLDELAARFRTDLRQGLSQKEAEERRRIYGSNVVPRVKPSLFKVYIAPFLNWLINIYLIMSVALAILAFFLIPEAWSRVIYWLSIVAVNALIAIIQQERAHIKLNALEELSAPRSKVVREGKLVEVSAEQLVLGDIIKLEQGDKIPADARIIDASNFRVNEASLTGESEEVEKLRGEMQLEECMTLSGIKNSVFLSTYVTTGCASALVTKTGKDTQIGMISRNLKEINTGEILLRKKVNKLAKYLALAVLFYLSVTLVIHIAIPSIISGDLFINGALNYRLIATEAYDHILTAMSVMPINIPLLTTIVLITGVLAMAGHRIIIRDLNAVESLGRVSVFCSDKTGTITKGEMTVKWIFLPVVRGKSILYGVTGAGYQPNGRILEVNLNVDLEKLLEEELEVLDGSEAEIKVGTRLELLLASGLLNNESSIVKEKVKTDRGEEVICKAFGNATDASILIMFRKSKLDEDFYKSTFQEVCNYPFDSKIKHATKVLGHNSKYVMFTKGATEAILPLCESILKDGEKEVETLNDEGKVFIDNKTDVFGASGFRVISFAYKYLDELPRECKNEREFLENNLTYLGFVAIIDPPREGVLESVLEAKSAGIKTVMITGDNVETGKSIAKEVGIFEEDNLTVEGRDIERLSDEEFLKTSVFARVSPEHKMDIIDRYKKGNHVVAMTGDGVNDALAISKADVGIAMGITGTDVAKEAADMVVADDSYNSIVSGIREGRGLFQKIRSIIFFYIAVNLAEALLYFGSSFMPRFHLLTTWQYLFITFTTHSIPPLALIIDRLNKDVMKEKPRDTDDIFSKRLVVALLLFSVSLSLVLYIGYFATLNGIIPVFEENKMGFIPSFSIHIPSNPLGWSHAKARTLLYTILVVAECTLVIPLRRMNKPIWRILKEDNYWVAWAFIIIVPVAFIVLMYAPQIQLISILHVGINLDLIDLTLIDWVIAISLGLIPIASLESYRLWLRKRGLFF